MQINCFKLIISDDEDEDDEDDEDDDEDNDIEEKFDDEVMKLFIDS